MPMCTLCQCKCCLLQRSQYFSSSPISGMSHNSPCLPLKRHMFIFLCCLYFPTNVCNIYTSVVQKILLTSWSQCMKYGDSWVNGDYKYWILTPCKNLFHWSQFLNMLRVRLWVPKSKIWALKKAIKKVLFWVSVNKVLKKVLKKILK